MTGSPARYDLLSHVYGVVADAAEHAARDAGLRLLDVQRGERVVEIGCGTGRALARLGDAAGREGSAWGVDRSAGMLAAAQARAARPFVLVRGDARRVPCRTASFDAAFMSFTLELFGPEEIPAVLSEVRRVLKPRGRLCVVSLNEEDTASVEAYEWLHRHFPSWIDCRPIAVLDVLADNGFRRKRSCRVEMWRLPVVAAVAEAQATRS